jgi:3-deoxy-manno-octulosonate cytidylyltransferase (CMP-KDO synthetase)
MNIADRCVVATDDASVADASRAAGAEAVMTSKGHVSGTDRVAEVAAMPEFAGFDTIVNVQGDEPFIGRQAVQGAADMFSTGNLGFAGSMDDC